MEIIVGKQGQQPFDITDPKVSRKHVKIISLPNGKYQLEDLGSSNGTFVDGQRIIRRVVTGDTIVQLGGSFSFKVSSAFTETTTSRQTFISHQTSSPYNQPQNQSKEPKIDEEVLRQFDKLEAIYSKYMEDKIALQKDNAQKGFMRMVPMSIMGIVGLVIGCVPQLGDFRLVISAVVVIVSGILLVKAYNSQSNLPEKMEVLNRQFQIDYVCPKCKCFLGFTPFEGLKNRTACPMCKTKLVR